MALVDLHGMESRQSVSNSPSTPCGRPQFSDFRFYPAESMTPDGHEDDEIHTMTERGSTSLVRETYQLLKEEVRYKLSLHSRGSIHA